MNRLKPKLAKIGLRLGLSICGGVLCVAVLLLLAMQTSLSVNAAPIDPPQGYPKLILSTKVVTPTLAGTGGATLQYIIEIVNTGAYMAEGTVFTDTIPTNTIYNDDASASVLPDPVFANGMLTWEGTVGFDSRVVISFSVDVDPGYAGIISNTAVINHAMIASPVTMTAETTITDDPILTIEKSSEPVIPGAGKPLIYTIAVTNIGQPTVNLPITVTDDVPLDTIFQDIDPYGMVSPQGDVVTWTRSVTLAYGETVPFTFSVLIDSDVSSGTIISNEFYQVTYSVSEVTVGEIYTVTVLDPIFFLFKETEPHPPGSNGEFTYLLTLLNKGSLAINLVISDTVPDGITYERGGSYSDGVVSWNYPSLDTGESAQFTYTVSVGDVAEVPVINQMYGVCSEEGVCLAGEPLSSTIKGPTFEATAELDPIAKKPGGGGGPVTPTLTAKNLGPGNALDATALLFFGRISVQLGDLLVIPAVGTLTDDGPACGDKCVSYRWVGDINAGEMITFTVFEGQSTIGGEEGTIYTATVVITDTLGDFTTEPVTATAYGKVTHYANLIPTKSAPPVIGAGYVMTYSITVFNSGLSTDEPPSPWLTDTVPASTTVMKISDGGVSMTVGEQTVVSWTLPAMGPGDRVFRSFSVQVDPDLISGTEIVNADYRTTWFDIAVTETGFLSNTGEPVTTVVKEVGLIDSYKEVTPRLALPGIGNVLTYVLHVVNSSPVTLTDVIVHDVLPWESSTYQRDATATSGEIISDIVSFDWIGDVGPLSSERITLTVLVDEYYKGAVTNTAWITHPTLKGDVEVYAVAYITDDPVLRITKKAFPDPVRVDQELLYTIRVENIGQQATNLFVSDTIPANTEYVAGSANAGGQLVGNQVQWEFPVLKPFEKRILTFRVKVLGGEEVINSSYMVTCAEGITYWGDPVITVVVRPRNPNIYLPFVHR